MRFHTTITGDIHKGTKVDCKVCTRLKKRRIKKAKTCACGKRLAHNNKSGMCYRCYQEYMKVHPELFPPGKGGNRYVITKKRKCSKCGKPIYANNKSGLCLSCLNKERAVNLKKKKSLLNRCVRCGRLLSRQNKSGYCLKCFKKSDNWKEQKQEHTAWIATNICGVDAHKPAAADS